jgi:hypothetical protein
LKRRCSRTDGEDPIFSEVPDRFNAGRYHSWVIDPKTMPEELLITATGEYGGIMALRHRDYPVFGVQFHPESIYDGTRTTDDPEFIELCSTTCRRNSYLILIAIYVSFFAPAHRRIENHADATIFAPCIQKKLS